MIHLINCHGEWHALLFMVTSIPFVGVWVKGMFISRNAEGCNGNR